MTNRTATAERTAAQQPAADAARVPLIAKVYGVVCIISSMVVLPLFALLIVRFVLAFFHGELDLELDTSVANIVIYSVAFALLFALSTLLLVLGIRLLLNRRRGAAQTAEAAGFVTLGVIVCNIMLSGFGPVNIPLLVVLVVSIMLASWLDPSLAQERELQRKLRDLEVREAAEDGTLGLDTTGKGYITLNFFNLFWIFVVASVIGLVIEDLYHFLVVEPGDIQDRAGLLFGPFSPIYGVGAVLMTMALNRFHKAPLAVIFFVSAVIGGAFEYLASWFFQFAFGIVAWDYTGTFLSIDGRTNGMFMAMWGVLGVAWMKLLLPGMLKLINLIPWNLRYTVTTVCAALMIADCGLTLLSFDCWYERLSGNEPASAMELFMDEHFDNAYMEHRFQSMTLDPAQAGRAGQTSLGG